MKNIAIAICLAGMASAAFAAGTEIVIPAGGYQGLAQPVLSEAEYNAAAKNGFQNSTYTTETTTTQEASSSSEKKVRFGSGPKNSPNAYWNHGRVNFGVGNFGNGAAGMNRW